MCLSDLGGLRSLRSIDTADTWLSLFEVTCFSFLGFAFPLTSSRSKAQSKANFA